jgi:hypothetical protein
LNITFFNCALPWRKLRTAVAQLTKEDAHIYERLAETEARLGRIEKRLDLQD